MPGNEAQLDLPPAQWSADPGYEYHYRYWDGAAWTDWVSDGVETLQVPLRLHRGDQESDSGPVQDDVVVGNPSIDAQSAEAHTHGSGYHFEGAAAEELSWSEIRTASDSLASRVNDIETRWARIETTIDTAQRTLGAEQQHWASTKHNWELAALPVERLSDYSKKAKPDPLRTAGLPTVGEVLSFPSDLKVIPGIGNVGANGIRRAIDRAREDIESHAVRLPLPDDVTDFDLAMLRAASTALAVSAIDADAVADAKRLATTATQLIKDIDSEKPSLFGRLLRRAPTDRAQSKGRAAVALLNSGQLTSTARSLTEIERSLASPTTLDDVRRDYRSRFADYVAVIDRASSSGPSASASQTAPIGRIRMPESVTSRIDAVELNVNGLDVVLRRYQEFGAKFVIAQKRVLLGDEMGLGKTIQALAAMQHLANTCGARHFLVLVPASILASWVKEIESRTDIPVHVMHGPTRDLAAHQWNVGGGIGITSYSTVQRLEAIATSEPDLLVGDEAHYVKNPQAKRTKATTALAGRAKHVLLMSGTPMENKVDELGSVLSIVQPELNTPVTNPKTGEEPSVATFRRSVAPVYLRRNQEDVLTELPEAIETDEWVELGAAEQTAHAEAVRAGNVMGMRQAATSGGGLSSAKMERLGELLEEYRASEQRVLVFSFFKSVLDVAGAVAGPHHRIDGSVTPGERQQIIDRFASPDGHMVLCSQIDAGGVGLNIQAASVVIILEPQFKPTTEWQAIGRAHRIGQTRRVMVHRLLARDCVDESLYAMVNRKERSFNTFARESALKDSSPDATDTTQSQVVTQLLATETARLQAA